tara:strand:+ start:1406 stop:3133 length:1728 start_codon:yes stop_codon:yes gene_type:complete
MGEDQILQLVSNSLKSPKGKSLLGGELDIVGITSRIAELSKKYNINLQSLSNASIDDINFSTGSKLSREQKREKRRLEKLSSTERLQERLKESDLDPEIAEKRIVAEIQLLKAQLKSQIPRFENFTITGRIFDKNTGEVLSGVNVTPGVSPTLFGTKTDINSVFGDNKEIELISNNIVIPNPADLAYIPAPQLIIIPLSTPSNGKVITDKQGRFSITLKIPVIPATQKVPLNIGLLYNKGGFIPGTGVIINGDRTVKTSLSASSLLNISEAAEVLSQEFSNVIDEAQRKVASISMDVFGQILSARKLSISKVVDAIKTKLIPLAIEMLIAFGIAKLSQSNRKTCPTPAALNNVLKNRNRIVRQLNQMYSSIAVNTLLAGAFLALSKSLKGVRLSLDALPAPQAIGIFPAKDFGGLIFAQPYSFTAKLQQVNDLLEDLEEKYEGMNRSTLTSLIFLIAGTVTVILLLQGIDKMTQQCAEINGSSDIELLAISSELLTIAEEEAGDGNPIVNKLNGFIFSVETDNQNLVGTLKRRFAVAKNPQGVTLLKGEPSFSSSDQILIDELVFYIQQNDLKAF